MRQPYLEVQEVLQHAAVLDSVAADKMMTRGPVDLDLQAVVELLRLLQPCQEYCRCRYKKENVSECRKEGQVVRTARRVLTT